MTVPPPEGCIVAYFDGACAPNNPGGHTGCGWIIWHGNLLKGDVADGLKHRKYLGVGDQFSNNVAEFEALICVFNTIEFYLNNGNIKEGFKRLHCVGDSQLVINMMTGAWKPKGGLYTNSFQTAVIRYHQFMNSLGIEVTFEWVRREQNIVADVLSKEAIEPYLKGAKV